MKIGIFGGSFNPVHNGHVKALRSFIHKCELDRVFIIPTLVPPHKKKAEDRASFEDRAAMLKIAVNGIEKAEISDVEKTLYEENGGKSYTKITLEHLKSQYPGEYYLYTGTDMFLMLEKWHCPEYLFENTTVAVMCRDDNLDAVMECKKHYEERFGARVVILDGEHLEASSTEVRDLALRGEDSPKIHPEVAEYIRKNGLYKKRLSRDELTELVKSTLPEKRFLHTLSVEKETRFLAGLLCPEFEEELSRAALLHDITKYSTPEDLPECQLTEDDIKSPETVHAKTGAIFARNIGENMWRTVMYHTTGRPDMSLFEEIIFLADYVEETRKHTSCIEERHRLHSELESADRSEMRRVIRRSVHRVLNATVNYLTEKQVFIHPLTLDALEYYRTF